MPKGKKDKSFMPMSVAGILTFSTDEAGGLKVPKWFPVLLSVVTGVVIIALQLM
ncbi:MAG: hypothetical protein QI197_04245 [Candidatus Korarchaeota archaeon]|nr:hypothetical protein [Candidatus Korarchaeota archaeon]MDK2384421.1 hypothetical protein [Candidatus Korarchaeota archaeon]